MRKAAAGRCTQAAISSHFHLSKLNGLSDFSNRRKWLCPSCAKTRFGGKLVVFLAIAGFFGYFYFTGDPTPSRVSNDVEQREPQTVDQFVDDPLGALPTEQGEPSTERPSEAADEMAPSEVDRGMAVTAKPRSRLDADKLTELENKRKVRTAVAEALATGQPQRWKTGKYRGYAVPSRQAVNGCRMIQLAVDGAEPTPAREHCAPQPSAGSTGHE